MNIDIRFANLGTEEMKAKKMSCNFSLPPHVGKAGIGTQHLQQLSAEQEFRVPLEFVSLRRSNTLFHVLGRVLQWTISFFGHSSVPFPSRESGYWYSIFA